MWIRDRQTGVSRFEIDPGAALAQVASGVATAVDAPPATAAAVEAHIPPAAKPKRKRK